MTVKWQGKGNCLSLLLLSLAAALALYRVIPVRHSAHRELNEIHGKLHTAFLHLSPLPSSLAPKPQVLGCKANLQRGFRLVPEY